MQKHKRSDDRYLSRHLDYILKRVLNLLAKPKYTTHEGPSE